MFRKIKRFHRIAIGFLLAGVLSASDSRATLPTANTCYAFIIGDGINIIKNIEDQNKCLTFTPQAMCWCKTPDDCISINGAPCRGWFGQ